MRQFDNLQSYLDNSGNPLHGRARFCNRKGILQEITDSDGNVIDSVVYTDSSGRLSRQVFLKDLDYKVIFETYEGDTSMNDGEPYEVDDEYWNFQFEVYSLYNTVKIDVDTSGIQCVGTMEELKATVPDDIAEYGGVRTVRLLGYNHVGDKPYVDYVWDEGSVADSDGGSIVKVDGIYKGRWLLVNNLERIDVRHFGAFPNVSQKVDMEQRTAVTTAANYARTAGLQLYFPSAGNFVYYDVSRLSVNNVCSDSKARMVCQEGAEAHFSGVDRLYASSSDEMSGKVYIVGDHLRTSYNPGNSKNVILEPSRIISLDTVYLAEARFSGVEVIVECDQEGGYFTDCSFSGSGRFSGGAFFNCKSLTEFMFTDDFDLGNTYECSTSVSGWKDLGKFVKFCISNGYTEIDLQGREIEGLPASDVKTIIANASFKGDISAGKYDFRGCTFNSNVSSEDSSFDSCTFKGNVTVESLDDGFVCSFKGCSLSAPIALSDKRTTKVGIVKNVIVTECSFPNTDPLALLQVSSVTETIAIKNFYVERNYGALWGTTEWMRTTTVSLYEQGSVPSGESGTYVTYIRDNSGVFHYTLNNPSLANGMNILLKSKCISCEIEGVVGRSDGYKSSDDGIAIEFQKKYGYVLTIDNPEFSTQKIVSVYGPTFLTGNRPPNQVTLSVRYRVIG